VINVVPLNDWIDHKMTPECACEPDMEIGDNGELLVIHNAIDLREVTEQNIGPITGCPWAVMRSYNGDS